MGVKAYTAWAVYVWPVVTDYTVITNIGMPCVGIIDIVIACTGISYLVKGQGFHSIVVGGNAHIGKRVGMCIHRRADMCIEQAHENYCTC